MSRLAALVLLGSLLTLSAGTGQEPKQPGRGAPAAKPQRGLYTVKNADPTALAEVVGQHFNGEAKVLAAPGGAVLVSGPSESVAEVLKLLEQLDRKPRTVEVEVTIAEVPAKDWKGAETKLDDLKASQNIKLTAVEGQQVSVQTGGSKPFVTSSTIAPGGGGFGGKGGGGGFNQKSVSYLPVGTTLKMLARVGSDDAVMLELNVQDTRLRTTDANDEPAAPASENSSLTTRVSVPTGKSVVAQAVRTEGKGGAMVAVVIVTARPVPTGPPK